MVFSSPIFLFAFLPAVLALYALARVVVRNRDDPGRERLPNFVLLSMSLAFYAWGESFFVLGLLFVIAISFTAGRVIAASEAPGTRRAALVVGVSFNLAILGFFKYFNFFIDSWNTSVTGVGIPGAGFSGAPEILLPLGISFYVFQSLSYVVDVYRGTIKPAGQFSQLACYVSMFPQLVAGPIVRYSAVADALNRRGVSLEDAAVGVRRFVVGLAKKLLIANTLAIPADEIFALPASELDAATAWIGILCYTLQIYFDFSGYSDMAIGLGRIFGFRFPENFRTPYASASIREFWQRWHISLSSWFRDYVYISLGGNRHKIWRVGANLIIVFFLCGLWHGASMRFVVWGLYHGSFLALERSAFGAWLDRIPRALAHAYSLLVVVVGWVFFRADDLSGGVDFLAAMFGAGAEASGSAGIHLNSRVMVTFAMAVLLSFPAPARLRKALEGPADGEGLSVGDVSLSVLRMAGLVIVGLLCGGTLASGTHDPFIYFRF